MMNFIARKQTSLSMGLFMMLVFLLSSCFFGDLTRYKRVGDTEYYLVEAVGAEPHVRLHYNIKDEKWFGEGVIHKGFAKDIYWNEDYIIVKCTDRESQEIISYCIIEQYGRASKYHPWVSHEFATEQEYETAKKEFGIDETRMNYTDSYLGPFAIHW